MGIVRGTGSARRRGSDGGGRRIRFREAIPLRRDRRDLRRQFRRAARAASAERKAEVTALLQRLSANQIPLAEVESGSRAREGIIEFLNGTRLLLVTRRGNADVQRLRERCRAARAPVGLVRLQPSFARRWFRLWFASADDPSLTEVIARVGPIPVGCQSSLG
jgi:hypothetical protein